MKINEVLVKGQKLLLENNIIEAKLKAKLLILDVLNIDKERYILIQNDEIENEKHVKYNKGIKDLIDNIPLEYVIGKAYFLDNEYIVNNDVLIPRLETELLVSKALEIINKNKIERILEIGTGSGIIGIHIVKNSNVEVLATDISKEALDVAEKNAKKLNVEFDRYNLIESNIYENIAGNFDLIISNPPYIKTKELENLNKDVLCEPILALDGGEDGLDFYKSIITDAYKYISNNKTFLLFEIGASLANDIVKLLKKNKWENIRIIKDFSSLDRIIIAEYRR